MKRRLLIFLAVIAVLFLGGFIYLKYFLLKAKDFKPDNSKAESVIDLGPSIVAKLQQLVKDGSNGLYNLAIDKVRPNVLTSQIDLYKIGLTVDTPRMKELDLQKKLPDDIFKVHVDSLHIDGLGIDYLLHSKTINVTAINIVGPEI